MRFLLFLALAGITHAATTHADLLKLFAEWRAFQRPALINGVPDYSPAAIRRQQQALPAWQQRLAAFDLAGWSLPEKIDYNLVRAEMNGLDFDLRVLRPWARNPFFYATVFANESDTPLHEGPHVYGALELWQYRQPLSVQDTDEILTKLNAVPRLLTQAKTNLVEDSKDLYAIGVWQKRRESAALAALAERDPKLATAARTAQNAVDQFATWLEARAKTMNRSAGIGVENYNWYLKNVHLVPYTWAELVTLMERELARTLATLKLEEQRNRELPPLQLPTSVEELDRRNNEAIDTLMNFQRQLFTVRNYMNLDRLRGVRQLLPAADLDVFSNVEYRDSIPMKTHAIHWIEKQRLDKEPHPSPVRASRLLYNIWDSRSEGFATAWEEVTMNAGLFDQRRRARELIYFMGAVRAIRGLADLKFHSGEFTLEQAQKFIVEKTPNGWFNPKGNTVWVDMAIYATQPSYGTTYLGGKIAFDHLLADMRPMPFKDFMDAFFAVGVIPMSMVRWELTGLDDEARKLGLRR
ncbi:MAG: DUF885 domain-containing protein [Bryobacteraceae bacterium]|nr:DUF885 domain-containing protein [Bryobacteraceae bacterium]